MVRAAPWVSRFYEADQRFWPLAAAAERFADHADFPEPSELRAPGVRFVPATKSRRRRPRRVAETGYDQRVLGGEVPTRRRSWHDFLNALVWATFPASKRALHAAQARALAESAAPGARTRPHARSREHDALALFDEGGVIELRDARATLPLAFGHALYEGLVCGGPAATASCLVFALPALPAAALACAVADRLLAERLREPLSPEALERRAF